MLSMCISCRSCSLIEAPLNHEESREEITLLMFENCRASAIHVPIPLVFYVRIGSHCWRRRRLRGDMSLALCVSQCIRGGYVLHDGDGITRLRVGDHHLTVLVWLLVRNSACSLSSSRAETA